MASTPLRLLALLGHFCSAPDLLRFSRVPRFSEPANRAYLGVREGTLPPISTLVWA
jgi:hypothetical protein